MPNDDMEGLVLAVSPDASRCAACMFIAANRADGRLATWDTQTGKLLKESMKSARRWRFHQIANVW